MNDSRRPTSPILARALRLRPPEIETRPAPVHHCGRDGIDPYAWLRDAQWQQVMRDPSCLSPDIRAMLEAENTYHDQVMAPVQTLERQLYAEMRGRIREDDASVPERDREWFYYSRFREGGQYPIFARRPAGPDGGISGEEQILFDGDHEAEGFAYFDIGAFVHSPDQRLAVWAVDTVGSEYYTLRIRDLETGRDLATLTEEAYGSVVWGMDSRTLYWVWRDEHTRPKRVYRQAQDSPAELLYEEPDDGFFLHVDRSEGDTWIVIESGDHVTSEVRLVDAHDPASRPLLVAAREPGVQYDLIEAGGSMYVCTNLEGAIDFRILRAPLADPRREHWEAFIPHRPGVYITGVLGFRDWLVRSERTRALPRLIVHRLRDGVEYTIDFQQDAYALGMDPGFEFATDTLRFSYESPSVPPQTWDFDMATRTRVLRKQEEIPSGHDPDAYRVERLYLRARDGAEIPVTLLSRADRNPGEPAPLLLYGYGAYGLSMPARFSISQFSLVDRGMIYATVHVRGGSEHGYGWYLDGKLENKTNSFNDFIDAASTLIDRGYTAPRQIVAFGGSAGGLLVGAAMNAAPELFAGVIGAVPFVDVLNTLCDASLPLTPPEWNEWGNPLEDPVACETIRSWSPYEQVRAQDYPHVLATAGLADPRVTYWEPAKWVARLRALRTDPGLTLLRTHMDAGHGGSSGRFESLHERARDFSFALLVVGLAEGSPPVPEDAPHPGGTGSGPALGIDR